MTQVDGYLPTLFDMNSVARFPIIGRGGGLLWPGEGDGVPADGEGEAGHGRRHVRAAQGHHQHAQVGFGNTTG